MKTKFVFYTCKECQHEIKVDITPITPAQTYGPPESCSPEEGGEICPEECPECSTKIDIDECQEKLSSIEDYGDE